MIDTWTEAYEAFDDYLNEIYETVEIIGIRFYPSDILREVDPVAYRCTFNDWADSIRLDTDELTGYPERH